MNKFKDPDMNLSPFHIEPKNWWSYLNPFWWRRKKIIEAVMAYQWSKEGMDKKINEAIKNAYLYGSSFPPEAWKTDEDSPPKLPSSTTP